MKATLNEDLSGTWVVTGPWNEDPNTQVEVAVFSGPDARKRADQYATWKYGEFDGPTPEA